MRPPPVSVTENALSAILHPDRLTEALHRSGVLGDGRVRGASTESSRETVLSRIDRLRLVYDGPAPDAPATIVVKTSRADRAEIGWNGGRHEVAFYRDIAAANPGRLVPLCFDSACDEATKTWHLVLEDLTETHVTPKDWPLPPALPACESIVDAHARHQAMHWDSPRLATLMKGWRWRDDASAHSYLERLAAQVAGFAERLGDRLPAERRDLYARLLDAAPRLAARYRNGRDLTIVQGDSHVWNCFLPKAGGDDARLFDWDSWRIDVGTSDLAYMLAVHWYPDRRRRFERALLERYHDVLVAHGVAGYDRDAVAADYRLSVLWQITWPVTQEAYGIPAAIWWNNLERVMMAVDDLGCAELL